MLENLFYILGIVVLIIYLGNLPTKRDSTDAPGERSGLTLYRDAATGVQYVGTVSGGLTPRVDQNGKPFQKD